MARVSSNGGTKDKMMIDSGTSMNITQYGKKIVDQTPCDVSISLVDESTVQKNEQGERKVKWKGSDGPVEVKLTNTLVDPDVSISLLSVTDLVKKYLAVLFVPGKALIINQKDGNYIVAYTKQRPDGLYYIPEDQYVITVEKYGDSDTV